MVTLNIYEQIITLDGSKTIFSPLFGEACHSTYGAKTETEIYYVKGCDIENKILKNKSINILEIGFGTGLGLICTFEKLNPLNLPILFVTTEIDPYFLEHYNNQLNFLITKHSTHWTLVKDNMNATILIGDARTTLPNFNEYKFDAIYQDAFSPKKNPTLWTVEWFATLKEKANSDCIMTTYSASSSIRKSMIKAGWKVDFGEKFSGKKSSTKATIQGESNPQIVEHLKNSPVPLILDATTDEFIKLR